MPQWRITRLRGGYYVTWDDNGIRRRYKLGTDDAQEAHRLATSRFATLARPRGTTVKAIWDAYLLDMHGRAVTETMKHTWKALAARFASLEAEKITIDDCRAHILERRCVRTDRHPKGIQDGTIHTELGHLRMVLKWAEKHQIISKAVAIERPSKPEPKDGFLTRQEALRLIDNTNAPHVRLAIQLMIGTGARVAAALELTWDRVDMERGMIALRNPFDRSRRKGRATVPSNPRLLEALRLAKKGAQTPFVIEWAGQPIKSIKKGLKSAGEAIGRGDVSPHMLRHSAAVWLAEDGHSMEEISQFLGHNDAKITARVYAKFSPTHLRKLAASLEI